MKRLHQSTIIVLNKDQQKTSTYQVNSWLLNHIKPTLIGLTAVSAISFVGLIGLGVKYYQTASLNSELHEQVKYLDNYTSAEATATVNELKKSEKTINELESYLQERGANNPPPKGKNEVDNNISVGGVYRPISSQSPFSGSYNNNVQQILENIRVLPIGVPHSGVLNSRFGNRPNPFSGRGAENHSGLDFKGEIGEPVEVTADGEVVQAGGAGGYGNAIKIKHGHNYETLYAHLSAINVTVGQRVKAGDIIGQLGNTGRSTGPHLHYEVRLNGTPVDPENFLTLNK